MCLGAMYVATPMTALLTDWPVAVNHRCRSLVVETIPKHRDFNGADDGYKKLRQVSSTCRWAAGHF